MNHFIAHNNERMLNKTRNTSDIFLWGLFIIWPFLAFIIACYNFGNSQSRKVILAFFVVYGFLLYVNPLADAQRRADQLKIVYNEPFENAFISINLLYEETTDFVEPVLIYSVSRVTNFHGALFALYALIYGSLMLYYVKIYYNHYKYNKNANNFIFLILLFVVLPIHDINGFRMYAAAWIFAVGAVMYINQRKYSSILICASSIFLHFSYIPIVILFLIYIILGNRSLLYGSIAIITLFVTELDVQLVRNYVALLGSALEQKVVSYTSEEYMEIVLELRSEYAWFVNIKDLGIHYFTLISLVIVFIKTKGIFSNAITNSFYSFSLLLLSFANLASLLPSGGRFMTIFYLFAFSTLLLYYTYENRGNKLTKINLLASPILVLYLIFAFRIFSDSASIYLIGPSIIMPLAFMENISLRSVLF